MKIDATPLEGCFLVTLDQHYDNRGVFFELYQRFRYDLIPQQINCSCSVINTVRGLHLAPYTKIVTCLNGKIFDVAVDMRENSSTYLKWYGVELARDKQLIVPANFAHGFMALEENSIVVYSQDATYQLGVEKTIHWRDPKIKVDWVKRPYYVLSEKDEIAKFL